MTRLRISRVSGAMGQIGAMGRSGNHDNSYISHRTHNSHISHNSHRAERGQDLIERAFCAGARPSGVATYNLVPEAIAERLRLWDERQGGEV